MQARAKTTCIVLAIILAVSITGLFLSLGLLFIGDKNHHHEANCTVLFCQIVKEPYSCDYTCYGGGWRSPPSCTTYECLDYTVTLELTDKTDNGLPYIHVYNHTFTNDEDDHKREYDPGICGWYLGYIIPWEPYATCYYDDRRINSSLSLVPYGPSTRGVVTVATFSAISGIILLFILFTPLIC